MPLEITQREMNGIYLLALKGRLVLGQESSGRIDDGRDIFGFSLQSVVGGITARSVATTVHRTNREARFE